jgi:glucoamylase
LFVLALGFGLDESEAGHQALASLLADPGELQVEYERSWQEWQAKRNIPQRAVQSGRDLGRISAAVLRVHESAVAPGAIIASLSTPWGEVRGDAQPEPGTGGYHLVWPRDLVEAAGGHLAAGSREEAARVLHYLQVTQMADGHWTQNMWVSGAPFHNGVQLGETALPILLVDLLLREKVLFSEDLARYWPMVRAAAAYILRSGPSTQQDRWENKNGYTPFTLAAVIAALLVAADLADRQGETAIAAYLRETADAWNAAIESWLYVVGSDLAQRIGVEGGSCHPSRMKIPRPGPAISSGRMSILSGGIARPPESTDPISGGRAFGSMRLSVLMRSHWCVSAFARRTTPGSSTR